MKRSQISRGAPIDADGRRRFSAFAAGRKPLERKSMARSAMKRTPRKRMSTADDAFGKFVRSLPCCVCGTTRNIEASHVALSADQKGVGIKVPHAQRVPHCGGPRGCHAAWEQRKGRFAGFTREQRYELAAVWVRTVHLLAVPEDRNAAEHFENLGLGTIVADAHGWAWAPATAVSP